MSQIPQDIIVRRPDSERVERDDKKETTNISLAKLWCVLISVIKKKEFYYIAIWLSV